MSHQVDEAVYRRAIATVTNAGAGPRAIVDALVADGWRPTTACRCGCGMRLVTQLPGHPPYRQPRQGQGVRRRG